MFGYSNMTLDPKTRINDVLKKPVTLLVLSTQNEYQYGV